MSNIKVIGGLEDGNGINEIRVHRDGTVTMIPDITAPEAPAADEEVGDLSVGGTLAVSGTTTLSNDVTLLTGVDLVAATSGAGSMIGTGATQKLALWGATPAAQPASTGQTAGFTAGAGAAALVDSTFTGGSGTKAYTVGDIVKALKAAGIMAAS